ncbi:hypothetical protein FRB98_009015, partial [Tulasnella sp. 332]
MDSTAENEPPLPSVTFSDPDPGELSGFWSEYDKLADAFDKDMIGALNDNLDSLLIFAGLFSGVNSGALFYSLSNLSANPADTTNALLTGQIGALETQCRKRQKKFAGARRWHLKTVVEILPILLQFSLLAFFIGLIDFFWSLNTPIAILVIVLTGLAFLCYTYTVLAAILYPDCPFQSQVTELIRRIVKKLNKFHTPPHRDTLSTQNLRLPSVHLRDRQIRDEPGWASVLNRVKENLAIESGRSPWAWGRHGIRAIALGLEVVLEIVGIVDPEVKDGGDERNAEEANLHRECVMWTLKVADKKESILEAARSIPTFKTVEACEAIVQHPTRGTTNKAFNRLLVQLNTSLLDARAHRHSTNASWKDVIILGRALIHILLPMTPTSTERSIAWKALSKAWPGDELSHVPEFAELLLIALSVTPTPFRPAENSPFNCNNIEPQSIPLYIASLFSSATYSKRHETAVRHLIIRCLTADEVPIEHVLVCAWALKSMAPGRMSTGRNLCSEFWEAYTSKLDVASHVVTAIQVLDPNSTHECDRAFLKVVATLLTQLTKSSTHWKSFDLFTSRVYLLKAIGQLTTVEEPAAGGLRNDAIKVMDVLAKRPNLLFLDMPDYHSVANTIIIQISSGSLEHTSPAFEFLKTISKFALSVVPESPPYQAFLPHAAQWLKAVMHLITMKAERTVPEALHQRRDDVAMWRLWAEGVLRDVMRRPQLAFWDGETICQVFSSGRSLFSDAKKEKSLAIDELMIPLLKASWCKSLDIGHGHLRQHPEAARVLVDWMTSSIQGRWIEALAIIDHRKEGWLDHDEEDVHTLFRNAGLATAVVAPWKEGTDVDVYNKRNGILGILASKQAWRDPLVAAFIELVEKDKSWGDWPQVYKSMQRWMIWRIAAIIQKRAHPHPESSAVMFAMNLLGMGAEKLEEDREWFRSYPDIAGLLCFALQQPPSISDTAFETIDKKATAWFDHQDVDLHRIFIDQGMAPALISYLYPESRIGEESDRRNRVLCTLLSSQIWFDSLHESVAAGPIGVGGGSEEKFDIGQRARSVLDLHRLSSKHARSGIQTEALTSDKALRLVMDYVSRRKSDMEEVERASCWSYAMAVCERKASLHKLASGGGEPERIKITFRSLRFIAIRPMDSKPDNEPLRSTITFSGPDPGELTGFWSEYDKLADAFDKDMIDALNDNLDSLLIFAGLFSGVNSSALFYSLSNLSANPVNTTNALLVIVIQQLANGNASASNANALVNEAYTPQGSTVQNNAFFAASLVMSLLAAFGAVLAKQWLLHYTQTGQIGALETQCRKRQKKFSGARRWHLKTIVEVLPLLLQISLLAFFIGLIDFFWSLDTTIAALVMVLTGLASLAYTYTVIAATLFPDCPFQSHATELIRRIVKHAKKYITHHHRPRFTAHNLGLPSTHPQNVQTGNARGWVYILKKGREILGMESGSSAPAWGRHGLGVVAVALCMALRIVGVIETEIGGGGDERNAEEVNLHRECVMWTLKVADKKESILEAARSIPTFRTVDACEAILRHPTRRTTTTAFNRLLAQLNLSLLDARARGHSDNTSWKDVIVLGRALIHILLPMTPTSTDRSDAWRTLSKAWPGDELSHIPEFTELLLIALSVTPTPFRPAESSPFNCKNIDPRSIPLYIACLLSSATYSEVQESAVRSLIVTCLTAEEVPIEHVLVCAWALKSMSPGRTSTGDLCGGFWAAYRRWEFNSKSSPLLFRLLAYSLFSGVDVAPQVIAAIEILNVDSTKECDHAFLKVVATLLTQLTKSSTHWKSFDHLPSRMALLQALQRLTDAKAPATGGLRNDAINIMEVLARRPDLLFLEMSEYHVAADTIIIQITSDTVTDIKGSPAFEFLKTTSEFVLRLVPGSVQYTLFQPHGVLWLRIVTHLATDRSKYSVPELLEKEDDVVTCRSWAVITLRNVMERPQLAFWDADTICRVLSSYESLFSESKKQSSLAVGELMLPLLETSWCQSLAISHTLLREHSKTAWALVDWMKSSIQDLWVEGLVVVDHWKKSWLDHDDEDIHMMFLNAGFAAAVVAPWKQGTGVIVDVYSKRNGILEILAPKPVWRDALVAAFVAVAVKDKGWGDWPQVYKSMERWMIWRMAAIIPEQPQPDPSAVFFAVHLMGMGVEKLEEDLRWFRSYPGIARLLSFALQQRSSVTDAAFDTIEKKAVVWFDHKEMDLHQIFIDQGMAAALICYLYPESRIGEERKRHNKILGSLLRSQLWIDAFYRSAVLGQTGAGGDPDDVEKEKLDIGLRARSVLDLHRLMRESSIQTGSDIQIEAWTSDQALRVVIDYVERRKSELQEVELASCWTYAMAAYQHRTQNQSDGQATDGDETERSKITFQCQNDCCRWTASKPSATSLARL